MAWSPSDVRRAGPSLTTASAVLGAVLMAGCGAASGAEIDLGAQDPCAVLGAAELSSLSLAGSGSPGGVAGVRQCEWENTGDASDSYLAFVDSTGGTPTLGPSNFELHYDIASSTVDTVSDVSVAGRAARQLQVRDPAEGHTGCIVEVQVGQDVVAVLDGDNAGDDVATPALCAHAQRVAEAVVTALS